MNKALLCIFWVVCCAAALSAQENSETENLKSSGWFVSDSDLKIEVPEGYYKKGKHDFSVKRLFKRKEEIDLIRTAEALYPDPAIEPEQEFLDPKLDSPPYWFTTMFDHTKIAYVITTRAIEYYAQISPATKLVGPGQKNTMISTSFKYEATVNQRSFFRYKDSEFKDVTVVVMKMSWDQYCGNLCAMGFGLKKLVVFNKEGNPILMLINDGSSAWVS